MRLDNNHFEFDLVRMLVIKYKLSNQSAMGVMERVQTNRRRTMLCRDISNSSSTQPVEVRSLATRSGCAFAILHGMKSMENTK